MVGEGLAYAGHKEGGRERAKGTSFGKRIVPSVSPSNPLLGILAAAIASGVVACMLAAGQAEYEDDPAMHDKRLQERVRARLDQWAPRDVNGLKHLKNAPGLTLITAPEDTVVIRPPEVITITIDDQISNVRAALTRKQREQQQLGSKNSDRYKDWLQECEALRVELRDLNRQKKTSGGGGLYKVVELTSVAK